MPQATLTVPDLDAFRHFNDLALTTTDQITETGGSILERLVLGPKTSAGGAAGKACPCDTLACQLASRPPRMPHHRTEDQDPRIPVPGLPNRVATEHRIGC